MDDGNGSQSAGSLKNLPCHIYIKTILVCHATHRLFMQIFVSLPEENDDKSLGYYTPSYADENS